ncbi:MAG: D-alanyl-D-alanine carboxypeptidase/D-alanyl-D-alanine-endopeptidase [Phycisphaerales bacterium]|nr:D-alanyl-D-alanine carboxypeptidase/D-alanyl-D-alanine-endopeptidase [Phycisphaerales bacterium]
MITDSTKPHRTAHFLSCIVALLLSLTPSLASAAPLDLALDSLIGNAPLGNGKAAIHIIDLDSGRELGEYRSNELMIPASNMKLLSSGAALLVLGDDFDYRTTFDILETDTGHSLIIRGSGDPALGDPAIFEDEEQSLTHEQLFDTLAQTLKDRGVESLNEIIVDDRIFDRTWTHPDWPIDQLNRWYCAEIGGLNLQSNVIKMYPIPGSLGGTPLLEMQPNLPWIDVQVKAKTVTKGRDSAWVARPTPANRFTLYGNVRGKTEIPVSVHEPSSFAGGVFAFALSERGIKINTNGYIDDAVRLADRSEDWSSTPIVAISTPISDVLNRTNTDSYNLYAESLIKRIGHEITGDPGSWENGASVVRLLLSEHVSASAAQDTIVADGSGMSRENKVSTRTLTSWMKVLAAQDSWDTFLESLAVPGEGTLKRRFTNAKLNSNLYAKSGYLNGVYALSGVLEHPSGRRAAFSIILNNIKPGSGSRGAKPFIQDVVVEIDQWLEEQSGGFGG